MSSVWNVRSSRVAILAVAALAGGCAASEEATAPRKGDGSKRDGTAPDAPVIVVTAPDAGREDGSGRDHPPPPPSACRRDEDCRLIDDCCSCAALPRGDSVPWCDTKKTCPMTTCAQYGGIQGAHCVAGRCIVGFDCDSAGVTCKRSPPVCPPGQTPLAVTDGGERCYGECVDAEQCLSVPACGACGPGALCLHTPSAPAVTHCVPWPGGCGSGASCACAASACAWPFASCSDPTPGQGPGIICGPSG